MSSAWRMHGYQIIPGGYLRTLAGVQMLEHVVRVSCGSHHINAEGPRRLGMKPGAPEALVQYNPLLRGDTWSVALRTIDSTLLHGWSSLVGKQHCPNIPIKASTVLRSRTSPLDGSLPSTSSPNIMPSCMFLLLHNASCAALMQKSVASRC